VVPKSDCFAAGDADVDVVDAVVVLSFIIRAFPPFFFLDWL